MNNTTIEVSGTRESESSIGALVDLKFNEFGNCNSASRLVWFPKSISKLKVVEYEYDFFGKVQVGKKYFITVPKWFLDKNNITYDKTDN